MQIVIGNNIRGNRSSGGNTPYAKLINKVWVGGVTGLFTFDFYLKEVDNSTSLVAGDPVELELYDGNVLLEKIEGVVGANINTFTPAAGSPTPTSSITNWASGVVQDGGNVSFAKKQWADANSLNYNNGSVAGTDWVSAAVQLRLKVFATDLSTGVKSNNTNNSMVIDRVVDLIEGSVFLQYTISGGGQDLIYSVTDNDSLTLGYAVPTAYEKYKDGVLLTNSLPSFSSGAFTWGARYIAYSIRNDINGYMLSNLSFSNGMQATNQIYVTSPANAQASIAYDRMIAGTQIADTFAQIPETSVSSTVVQRAMRNQDNITPSSPVGNVDVYVNGSFDKSVTPFSTGANSSEVNWFDLDMSYVGKRNTVRFETTMTASSYNIYNQFQIELNYVY
jgi:hypothetical protein